MRRAAVLATLCVLGGPAAAQADEAIVAGGGNRYLTPNITIDQGERVTFRNQDLSNHDVTADQNGPDGKPLFASDLIGAQRETPVVGVEYLTTGNYPFLCSVHPFMRGSITVTSAGTPVPRPAPPPDTAGPRLSLDIGRIARGRLTVRATSDEDARAALVAVGRVGSRSFSLGRAATALSAGSARSVRITLSRSARSRLRGRRSVVVTVRSVATDSAGNRREAAFRERVRL